MKLTEQNKAVFKSYFRGVLTAVTPLFVIGNTNQYAYIAAIAAGVIAPAIRAMDKKDATFGLVADALVKETEKIAKANVKKVASAKK